MNESTASPTQPHSPSELISRLELMETMMQEGRKCTSDGGWIFVLWGIADILAIEWSSHPVWGWRFAWSACMTIAAAITVIGSCAMKRTRPDTAVRRAIAATWIALGIALGVYCFSVFVSGHFEQRNLVAAGGAMLGAANFASAFILRWKMQFLAASIWWAAAVAACFVAETYIWPIFGIALILAYFGFGLYLMYCEHRERKSSVKASVEASVHHA